MVLVQKCLFFQLFFLANIGQENVIYDILERKKPFSAIKTKPSKSRKIDIFQKGLTHDFVPKMPIFTTFIFRQYSLRKCLLRYCRRKKRLSRLKKTRSSKTRKIDIFPNGLTHAFGPKVVIFPPFFFLGNIGQKNVFYEILEGKNACLGSQNKKFKKSKN